MPLIQIRLRCVMKSCVARWLTYQIPFSLHSRSFDRPVLFAYYTPSLLTMGSSYDELTFPACQLGGYCPRGSRYFRKLATAHLRNGAIMAYKVGHGVKCVSCLSFERPFEFALQSSFRCSVICFHGCHKSSASATEHKLSIIDGGMVVLGVESELLMSGWKWIFQASMLLIFRYRTSHSWWNTVPARVQIWSQLFAILSDARLFCLCLLLAYVLMIGYFKH